MDPQVIAGRYEVVRAIGSGGMGTVWLCRDTVLGREVAVKQVGALPGEPAAAARAMREARIAASLNHPNAVGVFDVVDEDDAHWLVMEFVDGQSLAERIREHGSLPPREVASIGASVADALARAHERGIVHRDVKPGNILLDPSGTPKVSDFGIARAHTDDQLTQTGFMTGTPGYLSPELAKGGDPTAASDVWALGATLYYAVEGRPPFEPQANPLAVLQDVAHGRARPMQQAGPLAGAITAMMDPDPQARWDMATTAQRLRSVAAGDQALALPPGAVPGAAAGDQGAAATEVIAQPTEVLGQPAEATQRVEPAPLGPPAAQGRRAERADERRRGNGWLVFVLLLAIAALAFAAYALTDGFGTRTPTEPTTSPVTTTQTRPTATTPSGSSSSSSSSSTSSSSSSTTSEAPTSTTEPPPSTTTTPPEETTTSQAPATTGG